MFPLFLHSACRHLIALTVFACVCSQSLFAADDSPTISILKLPESAASFRGLCVVNDHELWISGSQGTVFRTIDSGESWARIRVPNHEDADFRDIERLANGRVLLMAIGNGSASQVLISDDEGLTWSVVLQNQDEAGFFDGMDFLGNGQRGILFGDPINGRLDLYQTSDGGRSWNRLAEGQRPSMQEGEYAFAASGSSVQWSKTAVRIVTGGSVSRMHEAPQPTGPWKSIPLPLLQGTPSAGAFSLAVFDQTLAVIGGDYQKAEANGRNFAIRSSDAGGWDVPVQDFGHKACLQFVDATTLIACGRTGVIWSKDSGQTWQSISEAPYYTLGIHQQSATVYLAGPEGRAAKIQLPKNTQH